MLISVIRAGKGIFHFTGDLDAYNLELLDELTVHGAGDGAELRIRVDPTEEAALRNHQGFLDHLARAGASVRVERAPARPFRESWYEALSARSAQARKPLATKAVVDGENESA